MKHPRRRAPASTETPFHLQAAHMLRLGIRADAGFFFHVPNQGKRSLATGQLFKGMGMLPGLSDLVLIRTPSAWVPTASVVPIGNAGFLELKRPDGKGSLRAGQVEFRDMCKRLGLPWAEAKTLDEVAAFAKAFYGDGFRAVVS